jgi:hypothetical protein
MLSPAQVQAVTMLTMPPDGCVLVLQHLDMDGLSRFGAACRATRQILLDFDAVLWRNVVFRALSHPTLQLPRHLRSWAEAARALPPCVSSGRVALAHVPAGEFQRGCQRARISVGYDFWMAVAPVTRAEFARWAVGRPRAKAKVTDHDDHAANTPVTGVSWHLATEFAGSTSGGWGGSWRLPTLTEWEKAARSCDGRRFPRYVWSRRSTTMARCPSNVAALSADVCRGDRRVAACCQSRSRLQPSTALPQLEAEPAIPGGPWTVEIATCAGGASAYGCLDMVGDLFEWCQEDPDGYLVHSDCDDDDDSDSEPPGSVDEWWNGDLHELFDGPRVGMQPNRRHVRQVCTS